MPHVITQSCCNDASCVPVCPVDCIHPTPDESDFRRTEMLYIDADVCIDCGACLDACPVEAIVPDDELSEFNMRYLEINALPYQSDPAPATPEPVARAPIVILEERRPLRVAVVGSGPAAWYAAEQLLGRRDVDVEVDVFERLTAIGGLVRYGVAPDHQTTKGIIDQFERTARRDRLNLYLNVEVGTHLSHEELLEHHHAVIYAVGASADRRLGVPGEDLAGSLGAPGFVGWYNGHPDLAGLEVDLSAERAVVVGNGNVALDVARLLVADVDQLARTDIADHALEVLATSRVSEVVVVGRRGPAQAAYTIPELLALGHLDGAGVVTDPAEVELDEVTLAALAARPDPIAAYKAQLASEYAAMPRARDRRIVLRYLRSPVEILGTDRVEGIRLARTRLVAGAEGTVATQVLDEYEHLECGLVIRSVGYRGRPIAGLPFDEVTGRVPNADGRVLDPATGAVQPATYVTGWIKRGPSGVIGSNKGCAADTVRHLIEDFAAGALAAPSATRDDLDALVRARQEDALGYADWQAINRHELALGSERGRPRVKLVDAAEAVDAARIESERALAG